jgi:endonuclease/exonuclease/phosphatase (EEP) superfamily protein YafD
VNVTVTLILTAAFLLPLIARLKRWSSQVLTPLAAFTPVAALIAVAATLAAVAVAWWSAAILAVPTVILVGSQLPRRRPSPRRAQEPDAPPAGSQPVTVRLLTLNALVGRADPATIFRYVQELQADVLAIQELTPELVASLTDAGLPELLPFSCLDPRAGHTGIGLWASRPLSPLPAVPGVWNPMPRTQLDVGWPVTITLVHPQAPLRGGQPGWRLDLERLRSALTDTAGQQLVAGDFNASRDHGAFRQLLAAQFADCADAAQRRPWPGFTWPANRRYPPVMRLDHVLVSRLGAIVREARTVDVPGTDHRGVLAVVELEPIQSDGPKAPWHSAWSAGHAG